MPLKRDIDEHIVDYLIKGDREITDPLLINWLEQNKSNRIEFNRYRKIWNETKYYIEPDAFDTEQVWGKINESCQTKEKGHRLLKNIFFTTIGVAASLLILFMPSLLGIVEKKSDITVSMTTDYGNRSEVVLPDGTSVKLSAGSNITYSFDQKKKIREVRFQGEGYFDVSKSEIPFVVKTENNLEIKVLGTSFNLQAYSNDPLIQASLIEGSIDLEHNGDILSMNAGDMVVFDKETKDLKKIEGVLSHTYGWLENKLYMDNMSLADVCKNLERWYNVEITLQEKLGEEYHYNGVIQEETIVDVMEALTRLSNIRYHIKGKSIRITTK